LSIDGIFQPATLVWAQLEPGAFAGERRVVDLGAMRVVWRSYNLGFKLEGELPPGRSLIGVTAGREACVSWDGGEASADDVAIGAGAIELATSGAGGVYGVLVDARELERQFPDSLPARLLAKNSRETHLKRSAMHANRLRAFVRWLLGHDERPAPLCRAEFARPDRAQALLWLLAAAVAPEGESNERPRRVDRRVAAVRACENYMRANIGTDIALADLTRVSGMRSRSLTYAFHAVTGLSPMAYLKRQRLNGVRQALLRADRLRTRIADVASDWGFWHMSHFTVAYRALFDETPSQTLRRAAREPIARAQPSGAHAFA
jgi:AraC family transcriptional regulator, ethanolamine operon transcriptional activator